MRSFTCSDLEQFSLTDLKNLVKKLGAEKALEKVLKRASRTRATKRDYCEALALFNKGMDAKKVIAGVGAGAGALALLGTGALAVKRNIQKQSAEKKILKGQCKSGKSIPKHKIGPHKEMHEYCKDKFGDRHVAYTEYPDDAHKYDKGKAPAACCRELEAGTDRGEYLQALESTDVAVSVFLVDELDRANLSLHNIMKVVGECVSDNYCAITNEQGTSLKSAWNIYARAVGEHINLLNDSVCNERKCVNLNELKDIVNRNKDQLIKLQELFIEVVTTFRTNGKTNSSLAQKITQPFVSIYNACYSFIYMVWTYRMRIIAFFTSLDASIGLLGYALSWGGDSTSALQSAFRTVFDRICRYHTSNAIMGAMAIEAFCYWALRTKTQIFNLVFQTVRMGPLLANTMVAKITEWNPAITAISFGFTVTLADFKTKLVEGTKVLPEGETTQSWEEMVTHWLIEHSIMSKGIYYAVFTWYVNTFKSAFWLACETQSNVNWIIGEWWNILSYPFREENEDLFNGVLRIAFQTGGSMASALQSSGHDALVYFEQSFPEELKEGSALALALVAVLTPLMKMAADHWRNLPVTEELLNTIVDSHEQISQRLNEKTKLPNIQALDKNETFQGEVKKMESLLEETKTQTQK